MDAVQRTAGKTNAQIVSFQNYNRLKNGSLEYCDVDDPIYKVCMDQGDDPGRQRLRLVNNWSRSGSTDYLALPNVDTGYSSSSSDCYYPIIKQLKDVQLEDTDRDRRQSWTVIPRSSFQVLSTSPKDRTANGEPGGAKTFLSSRSFAKHFVASFHLVAKQVKIQGLMANARVLGPRIICYQEDFSNPLSQDGMIAETRQDFLPTVGIPFWPDKAKEWQSRKRKIFQDRRTDITCQWPPKEAIIASIQCGGNLIPNSKPGKAKSFEWTASFIKSEHLLLKSLKPSMLKILLISLLIWKTYLQKSGDVTEDHIK